MDERDLQAEEPCPGLLVDEIGAGPRELDQRRAEIAHPVRNMVHTGPPLPRRDREPRIVFPFDFCLGTLNEHVAFGLFTARPVAGDVRMTVKNRPLPLSALLPRRALQSIFPEATAAPVSLWAAPMSTT